jgi:2,3-bisphosphoglycerate-dependent phosphoglycerate mutase
VQFAATKGILPSKEVDVCDSNGIIRKKQIPAIDVAFCSLLKRAADTMNLVLREVHLADVADNPVPKKNDRISTESEHEYQYHIPIIQSWRLNERHYGALVGLSKEGAERLYGRVRLTRWRDSWDVPPPPMPVEMLKKWGKETHCQPVTIINRVKTAATRSVDDYASRASCVKILEHGGKKKQMEVKIANDATISSDEAVEIKCHSFMPPSESLKDTYERFTPLWLQGIAPHLRAGRTVLVVGHANTIRSMLFAIDPEIVTKENSKQVKIPSALPLVYDFVDNHSSRLLNMIEGDGHTLNGHKNGKVYIDGRECSKPIPGNLRVLKPRRHSTSVNDTHPAEEVIYSDEVNRSKKEMKYSLNGIWVETDETKLVSFCTEAGRQAGEQDIA